MILGRPTVRPSPPLYLPLLEVASPTTRQHANLQFPVRGLMYGFHVAQAGLVLPAVHFCRVDVMYPWLSALDSSAVGITQLVAYEAGESNLCREGSDALFPNDFGEDLLLLYLFVFLSVCLHNSKSARPNSPNYCACCLSPVSVLL